MLRKLIALSFIVLVCALIGGCGKKAEINKPAADNALVQNSGTPDEGQAPDPANDQADETITPSGEYTINELLSMNKPLKCKWLESITNGGEVTNIIYLDNKKFYQDVTMGDIGHAYTISDGEYMYIWNDFTNKASKINIKEAEKKSAAEKTPAENTADLEQRRDFACESWVADSAVFNPPADKNFDDITDEMTQALGDLQDNSDTYKQQACDMCLKAPTQELVDQCLANAECNEE